MAALFATLKFLHLLYIGIHPTKCDNLRPNPETTRRDWQRGRRASAGKPCNPQQTARPDSTRKQNSPPNKRPPQDWPPCNPKPRRASAYPPRLFCKIPANYYICNINNAGHPQPPGQISPKNTKNYIKRKQTRKQCRICCYFVRPCFRLKYKIPNKLAGNPQKMRKYSSSIST